MNKKFLNYTDGQGTADTLHMYLQMLGKVKLMRCHQRPEWAHVRLYLTVEGVSTGIIPGDDSPFEIQANFMKHLVIFRNGNGKVVTFTLQNGLSVMEFYKQFMKGLEEIGSPTAINVRAQEFYDPIDFDKDTKHHHYDKVSFPVSGEKWMGRLTISVRWTSRESCIAVNRLRLA